MPFSQLTDSKRGSYKVVSGRNDNIVYTSLVSSRLMNDWTRKCLFFLYSVVSTAIWVGSDSKQGFYLSFYTYTAPPPLLKDSIIGLFPGIKCRIKSFLAEKAIREPCFESFPKETTRNEVVSLLDIWEPRTDQSRFHYLCLQAGH